MTFAAFGSFLTLKTIGLLHQQGQIAFEYRAPSKKRGGYRIRLTSLTSQSLVCRRSDFQASLLLCGSGRSDYDSIVKRRREEEVEEEEVKGRRRKKNLASFCCCHRRPREEGKAIMPQKTLPSPPPSLSLFFSSPTQACLSLSYPQTDAEVGESNIRTWEWRNWT